MLISSLQYGEEVGVIPIASIVVTLFIICINKRNEINFSKIYYIIIGICILNIMPNINHHLGFLQLTPNYYLNYRF